MTVAVLDPGSSFADIQSRLKKAGWIKIDSPGLRLPLRPGEPETALFENEETGAVLSYSFNPALGLRAIDGETLPSEAVLPWVDEQTVEGWIADDDPRHALRGVNAAAMIGLKGLSGAADQAVRNLPGDLVGYGRAAANRLKPNPIDKPTTARDVGVATFASLPLLMRRAVLRRSLFHDPDTASALLEIALADDDPELVAIAAVGAARLGRTELARTAASSSTQLTGVDRKTRARFNAIKSIALEILRREGGDDEPDAKKDFRSALLGQKEDGPDAAFFSALMTPDPEIDPVLETDDGRLVFHRIEQSPHWIGHEDSSRLNGEAGQQHRWQPERPFAISVTPSGAPMTLAEAEKRLETVSNEIGRDARLPTCMEWEAAMRGPGGYPRPWRFAARPPHGFVTGPWGLASPRSGGEWTILDGEAVVMGCEPHRHLAARRQATPTTLAHLRPVFVL